VASAAVVLLGPADDGTPDLSCETIPLTPDLLRAGC